MLKKDFLIQQNFDYSLKIENIAGFWLNTLRLTTLVSAVVMTLGLQS
jgi:hypothetical protein